MENEFLLIKEHAVEDDSLTSEQHEPYYLRYWQLPIEVLIRNQFESIRIDAWAKRAAKDLKKMLRETRKKKQKPN
jgi:hypothetical protein